MNIRSGWRKWERGYWRWLQTETASAVCVASTLCAVMSGTFAFWAVVTFAASRARFAATVSGFGLLLAVAFAAVAYFTFNETD